MFFHEINLSYFLRNFSIYPDFMDNRDKRWLNFVMKIISQKKNKKISRSSYSGATKVYIVN